MAKSTLQKARKEYKCSKCGCLINPGEEYYKITAMYTKPYYRCKNHAPERSELTSSEYLSWLYDLQDNLTDRYDLKEEGIIDELISELENQRDELQDKFDNIPEQLQDGDAGQTLQNRIDSLDDVISDLESLDYPEKEEIERSDYDSDEDYEEALKEIEDKFEEALDDYVSEIEDYIGGIEE